MAQAEMVQTLPLSQYLEVVAGELATASTFNRRNIDSEKKLAEKANTLLHAHDCPPDFTAAGKLSASGIKKSTWLPINSGNEYLNKNPGMRKWGYFKNWDGHIEDCDETTIDGCHFSGFELGTELGYEKELGDKWYFILSGSETTYYVPVESLQKIHDIYR